MTLVLVLLVLVLMVLSPNVRRYLWWLRDLPCSRRCCKDNMKHDGSTAPGTAQELVREKPRVAAMVSRHVELSAAANILRIRNLASYPRAQDREKFKSASFYTWPGRGTSIRRPQEITRGTKNC